MKPIPDKAEIVLEYPDKFYSGTFERSSHFDARMDQDAITLAFTRGGDAGERKSVHLHIHYRLFADILTELAKAAAADSRAAEAERSVLAEAAGSLARALRPDERVAGAGEDEAMTPDEEVELLHILE